MLPIETELAVKPALYKFEKSTFFLNLLSGLYPSTMSKVFCETGSVT